MREADAYAEPSGGHSHPPALLPFEWLAECEDSFAEFTGNPLHSLSW